MGILVIYICVGIYTSYIINKDALKKIPIIFRHEHILEALGYAGFITLMFIFGVFAWPLSALLFLTFNAGYLIDKYKDK